MTKITEKMVLPVLNVITLNIGNLKNDRTYKWCRDATTSITNYLGRNQFITESQWNLLRKIERQVLNETKVNLVTSKS